MIRVTIHGLNPVQAGEIRRKIEKHFHHSDKDVRVTVGTDVTIGAGKVCSFLTVSGDKSMPSDFPYQLSVASGGMEMEISPCTFIAATKRGK